MYMEEEVRRGMALLDEKVPDWRGKIDPKRLHMVVKTTCVLGQIFGEDETDEFVTTFGYDRGLVSLGLSEEDAEEYGFDAHTRTLEDWRSLEEAWKSLLQEPIAV